MGYRLVWSSSNRSKNTLEWAPPLRVVSVVTLFASTLDLIADFLLCNKIAQFLPNFQSDIALLAAYGYFFFVGVSVFVYVFEMTDVCLTLKNDFENVFNARLAKSLVLAAEEVPLPFLLNVLFLNEPRMSIAKPAYLASWIKLIALTWGIVKFVKLRFFWCCLPLNPKHDTEENFRRCFTLTLYRITMIFVNICHIIAIAIVVYNIVLTGKGGRRIKSNNA
uniref:THH1/TOM1/TOM3 domain-containing protein n=1 Tax=Setaria digitata TaxID=48799 RepID=A0A915Q3H7_9BILA